MSTPGLPPVPTVHDSLQSADASHPSRRRARGSGTMRERRPGVWEIRVAVGVDPATGRTRQRSVTVHGTRAQAETHRARLADKAVGTLGQPAADLLLLGELLSIWVEADHAWKPSTLVGYRSQARALRADPLAQMRASGLRPADIRQALRRWHAAGASTAVVAGRFRALRAALGWAYDERLIEDHPLRNMRGPARATPRRPIDDADVMTLLATANTALLEALANDTGTGASPRRRRRAEQDLLMVRLAADTGARRGEIVALRVSDLDGRVLHIDRAVSAGELTTPKSGHGRTLTLGATTAVLWHHLVADWQARTTAPIGPWLFASDPEHRHRLDASYLGHRFAALRDAAGVPEASLHRLRHSVATFLVARGQILQAQARLGHADAATTLREYAYALPLTDQAVAEQIDRHLTQPGGGSERAESSTGQNDPWII